MLYEWLQNIGFKNYWVLPFLLMLPVLAWMYFRSGKVKPAMMVSTLSWFRVKTGKNYSLHLPFWLRLIAIGCIIVALARPQVKHTTSKNKGEGIDIILCMDVSGSMLSQDFQPNRLSVARQMAADFVKGRPVDQIGLVIFAGESFTQFPLSTDHAALLENVRAITPGLLQDGTVIGEGLATSVDRLSSGKSRSKVIILLTDGNEQPPETRIIDPVTALEIAKAKEVKVYTIGMGARAGEIAERGVPRSQSSAFLDEVLLKRIATQTGGAYFRATNAQGLQDIYNQIDKLEKSEVEVITRERFDELFVYFIALALLFLFIELILRYSLLRTFP
jgi:Ca-activated chloride channel family protein